MAEYDFTAGPRKGKVYKEKYYLRNNKNFIQEAKKYIPINSQWLTKEEFKNYILSLLDKGIPQIYVLEELPEDLFPYALIFVQNEEKTSIYVDKEGIRTEINIGDDDYDAVNVVENLPQDLQNNVIYYSENKIDEQEVLEKGLNLDEQKSYIYVYEDEEIKQVIPNVDYIADEQMVFENKTINGEDNTIQNLIPEESIKPGYIINKIEESKMYYGFVNFDDSNDIVFLDTDGDFITSYVYRAILENNIITEILSKSDSKVYYDGNSFEYEGSDYEKYSVLDQFFPILNKSIAYSQAIKTYIDDKTEPINDLTTKSLRKVYNKTLSGNRIVYTDSDGCIQASAILATDVNIVVTGVSTKSLKNVYNKTLAANMLLCSDASGFVATIDINPVTASIVITGISTACLKNIYFATLTANRLLGTDASGFVGATGIDSNTASTVVTGVSTKSLKNVYNTTLTVNRLLGSDANGFVGASGIDITTAGNVVTGVSTKSLKNVYNTTLTANKLLGTDASGFVTTTDKYTVNSTLTMSGTTIGMPNKLDSGKSLALHQTAFDIQGRCIQAVTISLPHLYVHHYHYDKGGKGEVNFYIYSSIPNELTNQELGDYLWYLGCSEYYRAYPANGQSQYTGGIVNGIYVKQNSSGSVKYTFWVASYTINGNYQEELYLYTDAIYIRRLQLF